MSDDLRQRVEALELALTLAAGGTLAWAQAYVSAPDDGVVMSREELDELVGHLLRNELAKATMMFADAPTQSPVETFLRSAMRLFRADYARRVVRSMEHYRVTWADYAPPTEAQNPNERPQ